VSYRIKCLVQYDGSRFSGYQKQLDQRTVQQEIENALSKMHKHPVVIYASGRTDAGVHALGQVFHFISNLDIDLESWKRALNSLVPKDIYIINVEFVNCEFHSRFNVKIKEYRYYLSMKEYNPFRRQYVCFQKEKLDIDKLRQAIKLFEGTHDFTSFTSGKDVEDRVRTIYEVRLNILNDELEFIFRGNGFLRYQIRIMMGTLIEIAEGKREINSILSLYEVKDRTKAGFTAEPQGLYLYRVEY
jgi:tRNA pseudouridine38-40 synthase